MTNNQISRRIKNDYEGQQKCDRGQDEIVRSEKRDKTLGQNDLKRGQNVGKEVDLEEFCHANSLHN